MGKHTNKRADEGGKKKKDLQNSLQAFETKISLTEDEEGKLEHDRQKRIATREKKMERVLLHSRAN